MNLLNSFDILNIHFMEIKYLGHSSFLIKSKTGRLITDPYDSEMLGLKFPKIEADIVTISHNHKDHNKSNLVGGNPLIISMSGEYEKNGIRVFGFKTFHDKEQGAQRGENIVYKIEGDDISMLHCGDLGHILNDSLLDEIGEIDILFIPVGGAYTIDASEAEKIIKKIEPSIVIPMHYKSLKINQQNFQKLATIDEFNKIMGVENPIPQQKFTVKKEDLGEGVKVFVMEP